jgi:D-xylose transport system substrate-binding protein
VATAAPADAPLTPGRIAVLLPNDAPASRWATYDRPALARCFTEADAPYELYSAGDDAATQAEQAAEAIGDGAKVLLLAHVDDDAGAAVIALARREGVKVIDYDRLTTSGPGADLYVGFAPFDTGRLIAESLAPFVRALPVARRNVVVLSGPENSRAAALVGDGIRAVVEPYVSGGQWTLVADEVVDDNAATTARVAALLDGAAPIGAVFAADDALAGSVAAALRQLGLEPVRLSGRGATVEALQRILAGEQTLTLYEPAGPLSGAACQAAIAMLSGDEVVALTNRFIDNGAEQVPFIRLAPIVVTEDNLFTTVVADGFHSREAICVGEYAQYCPED